MCVCGDDIVAVILVNESCLPEWDVANNVYDPDYFVIHRTPTTLQQCKDACLFNPQCAAFAFAYRPHCYLYSSKVTNFRKDDKRFNTYKLVNRCDITPGL